MKETKSAKDAYEESSKLFFDLANLINSNPSRGRLIEACENYGAQMMNNANNIALREAKRSSPPRLYRDIGKLLQQRRADLVDRRASIQAEMAMLEISEQAIDLLGELRRGLLDMKRRNLLGPEHCPDDDQWIEIMLRRTRQLLKGENGD